MLAVGTIDYLNTQPIEHYLDAFLPNIPRLRNTPTVINEALVKGQVAVAAISSYEFACHAQDLLLIPDFSIATLGAVNSVLLFTWRADPRELDGALVALSDHSATSVNLLRVLCEQHYHICPEWRTMPQDLETMLTTCEAALLIGDQALREGVLRRHIGPRGLPYCFDLGDEWLKLTGLPFTFAVWAARRDQAAAIEAAGIIPALAAAKTQGLQNIATLAAAYAPRLGLPAGVCAKYLRDLRHNLEESDLQGLQTFLTYALPAFTWQQVRYFGSQRE